MKKAVIIGVGLIGGSFAKGLARIYPDCTILGIDHNTHHLDEAQRLGLIHAAGDVEDLTEADMVVIAIPVNATKERLPYILESVKDNALVFDAGSTKEAICKVVAQHPKRRNYLACHPIAGTEFSGPAAAFDGLFKDKTNIICEVEQTATPIQERALAFFQELGMHLRYMNPESHDKHIAYVSHLSHISSFMLGKTVIQEEENERDIFDMAGSGFESTVRLAKSSPAMWTPIFEQNKGNVIKSLKEYIKNLESFKKMMEDDDLEGIYEQMNNTNRIKEILKGIPHTKTN
ncbi:MAG: prephenate dehydrogenase [Bacteroidota bacterium]